MNKSLLFNVAALCLAFQCVHSQYQTAPAYGSGYQQQRKMAPNPQNYGQQQKVANRMKQATMSSNYGQQQQQQSSLVMGGEQKSSYGDEGGQTSAKLSYNKQQQQQNGPMNGNQYNQNGGSMMNNDGYKATKQSSGYGEQEQQYPPMPFNWGYDIDDGYGNTQYHKENSDDYGKRTGSYGYMDAYGVYRQVDYVADENGFRAYIKTNEPGTANENPADVDIKAEEPPTNTYPGNKQSYGGQKQQGSDSYKNSAASSYGTGDASGSELGSSSGYGSGSGLGGENKQQSSYGSSSSEIAERGMGMGPGTRYTPASMAQSVGGDSQYGMSLMSGDFAKQSAYSGGASARPLNSGKPMSTSATARSQSMSRGRYGGSNGSNGMDVGAAGSYAAANSMSMNGQAYGSGQSDRSSSGKMGRYSFGAKQQPMSQQSAYGSDSTGQIDQQMGQVPSYTSSVAMIDDLAATQQQQYESDSALAQQYGPSSMMNMIANGNAASMQQQYGPGNGMLSGDATSTYSSARRQQQQSTGYGSRTANGRQNEALRGQTDMAMTINGPNNSDYNMNSKLNSAPMITMGSAMGAMDYRRTAAKNIGALAKRY